MNRRLARPLVLAAALLLVLTSCNKATSGGEGAGGVKTGPGVTDDTIKLAGLIDLTAVFAPLGKNMVQGIQLYWKQKNADGGICGRSVEFTVKDTGYDPQRAIALYREVSPDVVGLQTVLGSPIITALKPAIEQDGIFAGFAGWSGAVLGDPRIQLVGTTYDIEAITGMEFLMDEAGLQPGDKVGHVYFEGDYGENALQGSKFVAGEENFTIVEQKIKPTDTDLSAQVAALRNAGVSAILVSAGPTQTASVAGVATSVGLSVPIVSNGPGFTPQLLDTPAGPALVENLHIVSSMAPVALDTPKAREVAEAFTEEYPDDVPTQVGSGFGYTQSLVTDAVLQKACDNKDLTRQGVVDAMHEITDLDTGGLVAGTLDYGDPNQPPTRQVYIAKADQSVPGGLSVVDGPLEAEYAKSYEPGQ
jgi:ABC-type branched-subunit amino acid transport system substrate-binding protein